LPVVSSEEDTFDDAGVVAFYEGGPVVTVVGEGGFVVFADFVVESQNLLLSSKHFIILLIHSIYNALVLLLIMLKLLIFFKPG
jgi:hypothetical protein